MIGIVGNENQVAGFGLIGIKRVIQLTGKISLSNIKKEMDTWKEVTLCFVPSTLKKDLAMTYPDIFIVEIPEGENADIDKLIKETIGIEQ